MLHHKVVKPIFIDKTLLKGSWPVRYYAYLFGLILGLAVLNVSFFVLLADTEHPIHLSSVSTNSPFRTMSSLCPVCRLFLSFTFIERLASRRSLVRMDTDLSESFLIYVGRNSLYLLRWRDGPWCMWQRMQSMFVQLFWMMPCPSDSVLPGMRHTLESIWYCVLQKVQVSDSINIRVYLVMYFCWKMYVSHCYRHIPKSE